MIDNIVIREIALQHGFKLEEQRNGEYDLTPCVYRFARSIANEMKQNGLNTSGIVLSFPDSFTDEMRKQAEGLNDQNVIIIDAMGRTPTQVRQAMLNALGHRRFKLKRRGDKLYMRYYYDHE